MGTVVALDASVRQTIDGQLVGDGQLPNAVALNSTPLVACGLIDLAVAGLIIAKIETGWETFLISIMAVDVFHSETRGLGFRQSWRPVG